MGALETGSRPADASVAPAQQPVTFAFTPDTDDAFCHAALAAGVVPLDGFRPSFTTADIATLNARAEAGVHEVTAISVASYPFVCGRYRILSAGASVGRGYGPELAAVRRDLPEDLAGRRVGIAGYRTTGGFLLRHYYPAAVPVVVDHREMAEELHAGRLDAAVLIHEELLLAKERGLRSLGNLGARFCRETGGPLPVGVNVVRRDLGKSAAIAIDRALRASIRHGLAHRDATLARVAGFDRGAMDEFVRKFANDDSVRLADDVRAALPRLLALVRARDGGPADVPLDLVDG